MSPARGWQYCFQPLRVDLSGVKHAVTDAGTGFPSEGEGTETQDVGALREPRGESLQPQHRLVAGSPCAIPLHNHHQLSNPGCSPSL